MAKRTNEVTPLRSRGKLQPFSRFAAQDVYLDGKRLTWGTWNPPVIPSAPTDVYVTVEQPFEARLDLYSHRFYQTPELWWVLAEANAIFFPFEELEVGTVLRIPAKLTLLQLGIVR